MSSSSPIVPSESSGQVGPRARGLARPEGGASPVHQAGKIDFGGRPRQECWDAVGPRTRERLRELAGDTIEWFAAADGSSADGRPYAVVFGERGLTIAEPRIDTEHRPVHAISAFVFDPGSLRHIAFDHRPPPGSSGTVPPAASGSPSSPGPDIGLSSAAKGIIGNLPPRAQELLQAPFNAGQTLLRCDWWYVGSEHRLSSFFVFLAGARHVTAAVGTMDIPVGHTAATSHWSLTCYRIDVQRRIGK